MKAIALAAVLVFSSVISSAQFPVSVDSVYTFIKYNSVYSNTANWQQIDTAFYNHIQKAKTLNDTIRCFVFVLEQLNDVHSQIFLNGKYYGNYPKFDDATLAWLKPVNDKANSLTNIIYTELISKKFAYIRVPSMQAYTSSQINELAGALRDSLGKFASLHPKGFIIDLRLNGGGNIYPMLAGLHALLGNNVFCYETDPADEVVRKWELKNGNFFIGDYQATDIAPFNNLDFLSLPVVVLTGPITKSSGSMTAIAFKGRPKTYFIGEPTADGYTTSNGFFQFADNLTMNFATYFVADRNKSIYKTTVPPDKLIYRGDNFDDLKNDKKIIAAIKWLSKKH